MSEEPLIIVEDRFLLERRGLVLAPLLPLPKDGRAFKPFADTVTLRFSDGVEKTFEAKFDLEHFSLVGGGSAWHIVVNLPEASKEDVPIGSRLLVSTETLNRLHGVSA